MLVMIVPKWVSAREAGGLVYANDQEKPAFGHHAWADIGENGEWIGVDPSWRAPATT